MLPAAACSSSRRICVTVFCRKQLYLGVSGIVCWVGHNSARLPILLQAKDAARVASEFVIPVRDHKMEVRMLCTSWRCHKCISIRQRCHPGAACAASAEGVTA